MRLPNKIEVILNKNPKMIGHPAVELNRQSHIAN